MLDFEPDSRHRTPGIVSGKPDPRPPPWLADHSRVKQPVLIPIRSRGHIPLIRLAASLNIDTQDRQDKQDEKLVHKKLIGSIIECAFVENLSVLRGPSRIPFESFPTPWNPFADSSFALLTDPLSPLVEISSPFPTFGGSLLSFLHPLSGPSSSLVALRGYLFLAFVDIFLSFVALRGLRVDPVRNAGQACRLGDRMSPSGVFAFLKIASTIGRVGEQRRECWAWSGKG